MSAAPLPIRSFADINAELALSFTRYLEAHGFRAPTIRSYNDSCARFVDYAGSANILESTRADVRMFLARLLERGLADNTVRLHMNALRSFFKFVRFSGISDNDPTLSMPRMKIRQRLPRVLTREEVEALVAAANTPLEKAVIEVTYATGCRVSELVNIRIENIDFAEHVILIRNGKGGKDRYVLYGRYAAMAIADYQAAHPSQGGLLFETNTHEPYSPRTIYAIVAAVAHRAGVEHVHPHSLRRAMASHMLVGGADIRSIQELLGHTSLSTTQIYTHLDADDLKKIHDKCHPHATGGSDDETTES